MRKIEFDKPEISRIIHKYNSGVSSLKLAKEYGVGDSTMLRLLAKHIKLRTNLESKNDRAYKLDNDFFSEINTEAKAWCLGLMFSDGNVCGNVVSITMCDLDVIEKFKSFIRYEGVIQVVKKRSAANKQPYTLYMSSLATVNHLIKHGCTPRKSLTLKFPTTVPDDLLRHFIRGYFDGDGCICVGKKPSASFTATYLMSVKLREILINNNVKCSIYKDKRATDSCAVTVVPAQLPNLYNFLYKDTDSSVRMDRKHDKFAEYIMLNEIKSAA